MIMIHSCLLLLNCLFMAFARFSVGDFFFLKSSLYIWEISPLSLIVVVNIVYILTLKMSKRFFFNGHFLNTLLFFGCVVS